MRPNFLIKVAAILVSLCGVSHAQGTMSFSNASVNDFKSIPSCLTMTAVLSDAGDFQASVYSTDGSTLGEIEAQTALHVLKADAREIILVPGGSNVNVVVDVAETGNSVPKVAFSCSNWRSPGIKVDSDGNGLYERATLFDADRDGSGPVVCTAKDTPDLACKVAGQVILRDWIDDANVMVRDHMEQSGELILPAATLVSWPCWDASRTTGDGGVDWNDPAAENTMVASGTSTGGTAFTLTDTGQAWDVDELVGYEITITVDAGVDRYFKIDSNTSDTITWLNDPVFPCHATDWPLPGCTGLLTGDATLDPSASDVYSIVMGSVFHDEATDTAYNDCPADELGLYRMINFSTRTWSGTVSGMGADPLRNDTADMGVGTSRPTGPMGTNIVQDYGTDDTYGYGAVVGGGTGFKGRSGWFGKARKSAQIVLGVDMEPRNRQTQSGTGAFVSWSRTMGAEHVGEISVDANTNGIPDDWDLVINGSPTSGVAVRSFNDSSQTYITDGVVIGDHLVIYDTSTGLSSNHTITTVTDEDSIQFTPTSQTALDLLDTYDIYSQENWHQNYVCICPSEAICGFSAGTIQGNDGGENFVDELNKDDILLISVEDPFATPETMSMGRVIADGTTFTTACGPDGLGERVYLGNVHTDVTNVAQTSRGSGVFHGRYTKHFRKVGVITEEYRNSTVMVRNLAIGPQDFMNEDGGDCATTYVKPWQEAVNGWTDHIGCDTGHMAAYVGMGSFVFEDVIFKHGGDYVIDGISHPNGRNLVHRSQFLYHRGKGIVDGPWNLRDVEIRDGHFNGDIMSAWAGPQEVRDVRVVNNIFAQFTTNASYSHNKLYQNIRFLGNTMDRGFLVNGGAYGLVFRDIYVDGWRNIPDRNGPTATKLTNTWKNAVIVFNGATNIYPLSGNTVDGVMLVNSIGGVLGLGESSNGNDLTSGNTFRNIKHFTIASAGPYVGVGATGQNPSHNRDLLQPGKDPGDEWCTVQFRGVGTVGDDGESQIAANNFFFDVWNDDKSVPLFGVSGNNTAGCEYGLYASYGAVPLTTPNDCKSGYTGAQECITGCALGQEADLLSIDNVCE